MNTTTATLANSEGCKLNGPIGIQRVLPLTVLPKPGINTAANRSKAINNRYGLCFCHTWTGVIRQTTSVILPKNMNKS